MNRSLFLFPTTQMALWAEEVAEEAALPVELVPAPPGNEGLCDLALQTFASLAGRVEVALASAGVEFTKVAG